MTDSDHSGLNNPVSSQFILSYPHFSTLPRHIGIIMDGNGRWAQRKKLPRVMGHRNAIRAVRETVETCAALKIEFLTLYAFSTENWLRPLEEVDFLMKLLEEFLKRELKTLMENNIRLRLIGNKDRLPDYTRKPFEKAIGETEHNTGLTLCLAVDYGSRKEILDACRSIATKVRDKEISPEEIDEAVFQNYLYTAEIPDLDLIIRTSGEKRLSNFMLWQASYAELYFTDTLWPDFNKDILFQSLSSFSERSRRMGKVVQLEGKTNEK